jgi:hypothetical protein
MDGVGFHFLCLDMYSLNCRLPRRSLISSQKISSRFLKNFRRLQLRGKQSMLLLFLMKFFHPDSCLLTTWLVLHLHISMFVTGLRLVWFKL